MLEVAHPREDAVVDGVCPGERTVERVGGRLELGRGHERVQPVGVVVVGSETAAANHLFAG